MNGKYLDSGVNYFNGSRQLNFKEFLQDKAGRTRVYDVNVDPKVVIELGAILAKFHPDEYGHAFWHYQHPETTIGADNCCTCKVIEEEHRAEAAATIPV